jgi:hypothetical protein
MLGSKAMSIPKLPAPMSARLVARLIAICLFVGLPVGMGCVDLAPPWDQKAADSGVDGVLTDGYGGSGGAAGSDGMSFLEGGVGGSVQVDAASSSMDGGPAFSTDAVVADAAADASKDNPATPDVSMDVPFVDFADVPSSPETRLGDARLPDIAEPDANHADANQADANDAAVEATQEIPAGLVVYYPCEKAGGAAGKTLLDMSGNGNHGTLAVGPVPTGGATGTHPDAETFTFVPGKTENSLALNAAKYAYVKLPEGILAQAREMTVATWVKVDSNANFQRVFDFGIDSYSFMYLTTNKSNAVRFRFSTTVDGIPDAAVVNEILEGKNPVPVGVWTHVAVSIGAQSASLFVDGTEVATTTDVVLRPSDLVAMPNNYIGRSEFPADPYLDGQIDEFRVYNRALSASEISALAGR